LPAPRAPAGRPVRIDLLGVNVCSVGMIVWKERPETRSNVSSEDYQAVACFTLQLKNILYLHETHSDREQPLVFERPIEAMHSLARLLFTSTTTAYGLSLSSTPSQSCISTSFWSPSIVTVRNFATESLLLPWCVVCTVPL
jgi:hypothetical protein